MKRVAILGCGPAGLLAAHAADIMGWDFTIFSRPVKSKLYGAQYLHKTIPKLDVGCGYVVSYKLQGSPQDYRRKVYGPEWDGPISPEDLTESHNAWNLRHAYDILWDKFEGEIVPADIVDGACYTEGHDNPFNGFDLVISTVPRKLWSRQGDVFESQKVWALGDTEQRRVYYRPDPFTVICNGNYTPTWYRVSNIFDYCTMEWPYRAAAYKGENTQPAHGASIVEKPLRHNSTARDDFIHLGRFGAWQKGVLTSDVFYTAITVFAQDRIESGI